MNPAAVAALGLASWPMGQPDLREIVPDEGLGRDIEAALDSATTVESTDEVRCVTIRHGDKDCHYKYSITPVRASVEERTSVVVVLATLRG